MLSFLSESVGVCCLPCLRGAGAAGSERPPSVVAATDVFPRLNVMPAGGRGDGSFVLLFTLIFAIVNIARMRGLKSKYNEIY